MKRNKGFKHTISAPATKFDGLNRLTYTPWKEALKRDAKGLHLDSAQWLELLQARMTGYANEVIPPALIV